MRNIKLSKKAYLSAFVFVTVLNAFLAVFLLRTVLAQKADETEQPPIVVAVVKQDDSPLRITIVSVDNSALSHQTIYYTVQNIGNKAIRTYTLLGTNRPGVVKTNTAYRITKLLQAGETDESEWFEERENIKPDESLSLSVDYVTFDDGTFWGGDTQKQSEIIAGNFAGQAKAAEEVRNLIKNKDISAMSETLSLKNAESILSKLDSKQSEKWQTGFRQGYNAVLTQLYFAFQKQGITGVSSKLENIESILKKETNK